MAATVSSVWAKPGAWALDSEEHEDELNKEMEAQKTHHHVPEPPAADFPSLSAAAAAKPKKKNKGQTLSLAEFSTYSAPKPATFSASQRLTQNEALVLPTGPRERTAEELDRSRLGGGFRNFGGDSSRVRVSDRNREGGFDGNSRGERDRDMGPSRADEVDDWSKAKKFGSFGGGSERGDRGDRREKVGFFGSSRADEVDKWGSGKSFAPASEAPRRERRMGFESYSNGSGPDADNWLKKKEERPVSVVDSDTWGRRRDERPEVDSETWGRKKEEGREIGNGNANGVGRPRLNLQPRSLPVANNGQSVTPTEGGKKGSNPFGEARPREEVLAEKGQDWKEIDEKLEAVKIKEVSEAEGFSRRKGFGMGRSESGDDRDVKTWRKPQSNDAAPRPSSAERTEESAEVTEEDAGTGSGTTEKVAEEN